MSTAHCPTGQSSFVCWDKNTSPKLIYTTWVFAIWSIVQLCWSLRYLVKHAFLWGGSSCKYSKILLKKHLEKCWSKSSTFSFWHNEAYCQTVFFCSSTQVSCLHLHSGREGREPLLHSLHTWMSFTNPQNSSGQMWDVFGEIQFQAFWRERPTPTPFTHELAGTGKEAAQYEGVNTLKWYFNKKVSLF